MRHHDAVEGSTLPIPGPLLDRLRAAAADHRRVRELCDRYADADIGFVDADILTLLPLDEA